MATIQRVLSFDVGVRHLAYCDLTVGPAKDEYRIHRWEVIDVEEETGGRGQDAILQVLDARFFDPPGGPKYDTVLIENQPARTNPTMKTVQVTLSTFFLMLRNYAGVVGNVRLVGATRKLHTLHGPRTATHDAVNGQGGGRPAYKARKAAAVRAAEHYLQHVLRDDERLAQLRSCKKRDDLSDCLLQAIACAERGLLSN